MRTTLEEARVAVARGAQFLDLHRPGWAAAISLDRFRMSCPKGCMLAQLYGSYNDGRKALGLDRRTEQVTHLGFCELTQGAGYDMLQIAWTEKISDRQNLGRTSEKPPRELVLA